MKKTLFAIGLSLAAIAPMGCTTAPKDPAQKANLVDEAGVSLRQFHRLDPSLKPVMDNSYGYVLFPDIGKGAFVAGAAYGRGVVYEQGQFIGYADIRQGSVGAQVGGQNFAELIVFQNKEGLYKLKMNTFNFAANAAAVALKANAAATTDFKDGIVVFIMPKGGLIADASISGQKFTYVPKDVADAPDKSKSTTMESSTSVKTEIKTETK